MAGLARISSSRSSSNLNQLNTTRSTAASEASSLSELEVPAVRSTAVESNTATTRSNSTTIADKYGLPSTPWGSIDWRNVNEPQNMSEGDVDQDKVLNFVEGTMYKLENGELQAKRDALLSKPLSPRNAMQLYRNPGSSEIEQMYAALGEEETRSYLQTYAKNNAAYNEAIDGFDPRSNPSRNLNPTWTPYSEAVTNWAAEQAVAGTLSPKSKLWEQVLGGKLVGEEYTAYAAYYRKPELSTEQQSAIDAFKAYQQRKYDNVWTAPRPRV